MDCLTMVEYVRRMDRHWRKRMSDPDLKHQAQELARKLARFDGLTIRRAVDRVIDDEPHYPTPAKLYLACAEVAERIRQPSTHDLDRCPQCHIAFELRTWLRAPRGEEIAGAFAPGNPYPGFVAKQRDYCDCGWRRMLSSRTETEIEAMGGLDDPILRDELRRRTVPERPLSPRLRLVRSVGNPMPDPVEAP